MDKPKHIGIIMDGNGRWAKKRGLPRKAGHREGGKAFKKCVEACIALKLEYVTFYALSTENTMRPADEVDALVKLFDEFLDEIRKEDDRNIRLRFLGDLLFFPESMRAKMRETEETTGSNTGLVCSLALNYGGRDEIIHAAKTLLHAGYPPEEFTEDIFSDCLYTKGMPEVDMIIRTGGDLRISNFLIWQAAYAELVVLDMMWPDFNKKSLEKALDEFAKRNRRFGNV